MKSIAIVCMLVVGAGSAQAGLKDSWGSKGTGGYNDYRNFGQFVASQRRGIAQFKKVVKHTVQQLIKLTKKNQPRARRSLAPLFKIVAKPAVKMRGPISYQMIHSDKPPSSSVPEPGSLALMLLGFGALLIARHRRREMTA